MLFSIYSVAGVVVSPFVPYLLKTRKASKVIGVTLFAFGVLMVCFGFVEYIDELGLVITYTVVLRVLQGVLGNIVQTAAYSIVASDFPTQKEQLLGYVEATIGVGNALGPFMGAVLYSVFGFAWTFYIYGGIVLFSAFLNNILDENDTLAQKPLCFVS
jgi:MFS family permease